MAHNYTVFLCYLWTKDSCFAFFISAEALFPMSYETAVNVMYDIDLSVTSIKTPYCLIRYLQVMID